MGPKKDDDDDDVSEEEMSVAKVLLELRQLIAMSEFKEAWKSSKPVWNVTKKRSVQTRKPRTVTEFKCGRGASFPSKECVSWAPRDDENGCLSTKKKKNTTTDSDKIKKLKLATTMPMEVIENQKPSSSGLKLKFKRSGNGHAVVAAEKYSSTSGRVSNDFSLAACCPGSSKSFVQAEPLTEPSSVVPDDKILNSNDNANPESLSDERDNNDDDIQMIPDLNISLINSEPDPIPNVLLPAVPDRDQALVLPTMLVQNNNNSNNVRGLVPVPVPLSLHSNENHGSDVRVAEAKEKRMIRMMKLRQRKMSNA